MIRHAASPAAWRGTCWPGASARADRRTAATGCAGADADLRQSRRRSAVQGALCRYRRMARHAGAPPLRPRRLQGHRHAVQLLPAAQGAVPGPLLPICDTGARQRKPGADRAGQRQQYRLRGCFGRLFRRDQRRRQWRDRRARPSLADPDYRRLSRQCRRRALFAGGGAAMYGPTAASTAISMAAAAAAIARWAAWNTPTACGTGRCPSCSARRWPSPNSFSDPHARHAPAEGQVPADRRCAWTRAAAAIPMRG